MKTIEDLANFGNRGSAAVIERIEKFSFMYSWVRGCAQVRHVAARFGARQWPIEISSSACYHSQTKP